MRLAIFTNSLSRTAPNGGSEIDEAVCIREFEKLAERLDIEIRIVAQAPSGLCTVRGRRILFIDKTFERKRKLAVFLREFRALELEGVFMPPILRKCLEMDDGPRDQ